MDLNEYEKTALKDAAERALNRLQRAVRDLEYARVEYEDAEETALVAQKKFDSLKQYLDD